MHEKIATLDDQAAVAVLTAFVQGLPDRQSAVTTLTPETREALRLTVPGEFQPTAQVTEGGLARTVLAVLFAMNRNTGGGLSIS